MPDPVTITLEEAVMTFTEWERLYREEPEKFQSDFARFTNSAEAYGTAAGAYFLDLLERLAKPF